MPTFGMQYYPFARNPVAHRPASQRSEPGSVVLLSVWKTEHTHGIKAPKDRANGQDLAINYIVFLQV